MVFQNIFIDLGSSMITGILGGLVIVWFFNGIHYFDKQLKFKTRYGKYSFIFYLLYIFLLFISSAVFLFTRIDSFSLVAFGIGIAFEIIILIWRPKLG